MKTKFSDLQRKNEERQNDRRPGVYRAGDEVEVKWFHSLVPTGYSWFKATVIRGPSNTYSGDTLCRFTDTVGHTRDWNFGGSRVRWPNV